MVEKCIAIKRDGNRCTNRRKYNDVCGIHKTHAKVTMYYTFINYFTSTVRNIFLWFSALLPEDKEDYLLLCDIIGAFDKKNGDCNICYATTSTGKMRCCSTAFCDDCIHKWLDISTSCPYCRNTEFD